MDVFRSCVASIPSPTTTTTTAATTTNRKQEEEQEEEVADADEATEDPFGAYVDLIVNFLTQTVYSKVSYGILTKHSLLFSFKLCTMLLLHQDQTLRSDTTIRRSEWSALLKGSVPPDSELAIESQHSSKHAPDSGVTYKKLKPEVISYEAWEGAALLDKALLSFNGLLTHIIHNTEMWVEFSRCETPWLAKFSNEEVLYQGSITKSRRRSSSIKQFALGNLNRFHRLMLVNVFCPRQFAGSARWLIEREMGPEYTLSQPRDLETVYPLTSSVVPVLIIITPSEWS